MPCFITYVIIFNFPKKIKLRESFNRGLVNTVAKPLNGHTEIKRQIVVILLASLIFAVNAHAEDNALASKSVHWFIKAKVITEDIDALKAVISELV
jgi:hypothetical protein